jgi:indolepyruvate ferredoxin oxidoreductase
VPEPPTGLPEPESRLTGDTALLRMPGIGGTGVVTVSQILQMAAHLDGRYAAGLEQIGLAQKGGPVVSDVRIGKQPVRGALRATRGTADVLIGFDLLGAAAEANLAVARPGHTIAVVSSAVVPTAAMVTGRVPVPGSPADALDRIAAATRADAALHVDAQGLSEALFGDHMPANMLLVGAAFQHGCIPIAAEAIEQAIRLNGAGVQKTLAAFRWGRAAVADPEAVAAATRGPAAPAEPSGFADVLATRVADLTGYQDARYGDRYAEEVQRVAAIATERAGAEAGERIAVAYARGLHKLMAYKDEYEVARLHLDPAEQARRDAEFGPGADVSVLLHPPVLRALGMTRKIRLRRSAGPAFRALRAARRLRGTALDPFGRAEVRRVERALVPEYQALVRSALEHLDPRNADAVAEIAALPDVVRGYEGIKLRNVAVFREKAAAALADLAT